MMIALFSIGPAELIVLAGIVAVIAILWNRLRRP